MKPFPKECRPLLAAFCLSLLLPLLLGLPVTAQAQSGAGNSGEEVTLNFVNADIESVVKAISQVSGRNFIMDPRVKGNINIVSGKPIPRPMAYQVLVSALRLQGYAVVEGGSATKILPEAEALTQAGPLVGRGGTSGEQVVTQVFPIRHESASQMVAVLKPLVSPHQSIAVHPGGNALVITDAADNLRRLEKIIAAIDVSHGNEPQVISLRHASVVEVAAQLNKLYGSSIPAGYTMGQPLPTLIAVPDPRANRLILRTDSPGLLARARALVAELDQEESGLGNIHVVYLKNAQAPRVAQTLRAILGGDNGAANNSQSAAALSTAAPTPPATTTTASQGSNTPPPQTSPAPLAPSASPTGGLQAGSLIQADVASNALIITAPGPIFNNLRNVIEMLDRRQAQVYIEALVVELSSERATEFGLQWQDFSGLGSNSNGSRFFGGTNFGGSGQNIISTAQNVGSAGQGLNIGVAKGQVYIPGIGTITNLGVLARFLESEAKANILSTPNILTLDNEEARIIVGQNLPFVTGSYTNTGSSSTSVTPFQTYLRQDVGLTLKVRPQITQGGVVRVQIYQETSTVQSGTASNTAGPTTNKRALESHVLVDDGNIIALGGLIEDDYGSGDDKVPVLGDLPVLGNLFRYETRKRKKTQLMVFLRPRIVRDSADYERYTQDRYEQLLGTQQQFARDQRGLIPESEPPRLPALQEPAP